MAGAPVELTPENYKAVTRSPGVCVVDCWAPWCEPCHDFTPIFTAAAARLPDITFARLDTEAQGAGQASQRLWQSRDRRLRGGDGSAAGEGFLFEGVALGELHPNLVTLAERQYAETQAMFYWLNDSDHVSPWQNNLRGSP